MKLSVIKRAYGHIVSLGLNCLPGIILRELQLKQPSLPLDWLVTNSATTVADLLSNRFEGFMMEKNLKVISADSVAGTFVVEDTAYKLLSIHDFSLKQNTPDHLYTYSQVKKTYNRRINRLYKIFNKSQFILFIRLYASKEEAIYLKNVLDRLVLNPYHLLVINHHASPAIREDQWDIDNVCSITTSIPHVNEKQKVTKFSRILKGVSIVPRTASTK